MLSIHQFYNQLQLLLLSIIYNKPMQPQNLEDSNIKTYRFLIIGRIGDGKSSLCQFLTDQQQIQISSKIGSCTHQCRLYRSSYKINQIRGYAIEVLDTPGLDSQKQNMLKIVMELADIFTETESINGILYSVSMGHSRDETISWFLKFLRLYFTKQQLSRSIIPLLTHYDKVIFEDDEKLMEMKNSRKEAIVRIWDDGEQQVINFWQNYIEWINDANQKPGLKENSDFKQIYYNQLNRLIEQATNIDLNLADNSKQFESNLIRKLSEQIDKSQIKYDISSQVLQPIKFKVNCNQSSIWKTIYEINNTSIFIIGLFVILSAKGHSDAKYKTYKKSIDQNEIGLCQEVKIGIQKIMAAKFIKQFYEWISVSTPSTGIWERIEVFMGRGMCQIQITLPKDTFFAIQQIQLVRISPESKQEVIMLDKKDNDNKIVFQDCRRFTDQDQRLYEFRNVKIKRPDDNFLNNILTNIIQSK